ncbi:hypothetical protein QNN03_36690 [Streptomyces sp. GXMU-J15]|uniref:Uncharacterized protein n=1 Tax=Streptomyces fuscus TaxID=3048495 RepID=A0ABT7JAS0_9ACTN|nr:hypothetical protein [Streptomyces fuscus]MDL2081978.1 hypothetical protein [Streptomyces fuscus]
MPTEWTFTLALNRQLTQDEAGLIDTRDDLPLFADGSVSYTIGGPGVSELHCDVVAKTLLEAIALVAEEIRKISGLRAVRVIHDDIVTLEMAAQRAKRSRQSLVQLSKGQRGPGGFPQPEEKVGGTTFYSWPRIAEFLRGLGDDIAPVPRDLVIADRALRLVDEVESAGQTVPMTVWRAFGLCTA